MQHLQPENKKNKERHSKSISKKHCSRKKKGSNSGQCFVNNLSWSFFGLKIIEISSNKLHCAILSFLHWSEFFPIKSKSNYNQKWLKWCVTKFIIWFSQSITNVNPGKLHPIFIMKSHHIILSKLFNL